VPFIAKWPSHIEAGSESSQLICNVDMVATMSALTGVEIQDGQAIDSVDVLPALTGTTSDAVRDDLVLAASRPGFLVIRKGKWVYVGGQGSGGFGGKTRGLHNFGGPPAITSAGYTNSDIEKGRIKADAPPAQLYDLENDLQQTTNLYNDYPEVVEEMEALLKTYQPARKKN
jgi:arylsulfatase A-like enzyme